MSDLRPLPYRTVNKKLRSFGFVIIWTTGSHERWWNKKTGRKCVVPHHKEIPKGTLRSIIRQAGLTEKEFLQKVK